MPFQWLARRALLVYLAVLALVAFWPTPVDAPAAGLIAKVLRKLHTWGAPPWINYSLLESTSNVLLFVPLGALLVWILGRSHWWVIAPAAFLASVAIELGQFLFLPARFPSFADIVANTTGALLGCTIACLLRRRIASGPERSVLPSRTTVGTRHR